MGQTVAHLHFLKDLPHSSTTVYRRSDLAHVFPDESFSPHVLCSAAEDMPVPTEVPSPTSLGDAEEEARHGQEMGLLGSMPSGSKDPNNGALRPKYLY